MHKSTLIYYNQMCHLIYFLIFSRLHYINRQISKNQNSTKPVIRIPMEPFIYRCIPQKCIKYKTLLSMWSAAMTPILFDCISGIILKCVNKKKKPCAVRSPVKALQSQNENNIYWLKTFHAYKTRLGHTDRDARSTRFCVCVCCLKIWTDF